MSCRANVLVGLAQTYLGVTGGSTTHKKIIDSYNKISPLPRNYKVKYTDAWCATFVSYCFSQLGALDIFPAECSCEKMIEKAKTMNIWRENEDYLPNIGDIVLYDWDDNGIGDCTERADHVGIVCSVNYSEQPTFTVIEGNCNNKVDTRTVKKNARYLRGFIIPNYTGSTAPFTPTNEKITALAKEVINGKWGHGVDRRRRLTEAGYDWKIIQNKVNELCGSSKRY